ncbi:YagK/YfjJ domain-containing protein [Aeromonas caviae]|uniref:YagK/YfjJ domain-containing protein n=1 Tax=Aeromonas caviae TaxID=648 RepID=UPI002B48AA0B|nr:inovirus-type Gp2 protein [Aeromonas caviae]
MPVINDASSLTLPFNYEYQGHAWAVIKSINIRQEIMDGIFQIMEKFFSKTSKLTAIRLELKMRLWTKDNKPISKFLQQLKCQLINHYGQLYNGYIWVREKGKSKAQHYHLALLLDGQQVKHSDTVYRIAKAIWTYGNLSLPDNPFYHVHRDRLDEHRLLIYRLSYLAKAETKGERPPAVKDYQFSRTIRRN